MTWRSLWGCSCLAIAAPIAWPQAANAKDDARQRVDIEASSLPDAIAELSREAGVSIGGEGALPPLMIRPVHGSFTAQVALERLLRGSGYVARRVGPTAWRIEPERPAERPASPPAATADAAYPGAEIVVRATKRNLTLKRVPAAATVVTLSPGDSSNPATGSQRVAERSEGLTLTGQGPGLNRMFLRGISDSPFGGKSQSTVAILFDDARVTYSAPDPDIRLVDVERVELLKGPQGSLYGTGALGGIYRIVSRRADPSSFSIEGSAASEAIGGGGFGAGGSLIVNLPLARDIAALRLVAYGEHSPGWLDTGDRADSNSTTVAGFRAGLGIDLADGWRADVTGFGQWLRANDSSYTYAPEVDKRAAQLPEPHSNDIKHASLRIAREGPTQIVLSTGYTIHDVDDRFDATRGAESLGLVDPQTLDDDSHYRLWDSELRITGQWHRLGWLAGVSQVSSWQNARRILQGAGGTSITIEEVRRRASESALFGEATLPLTAALDATLGGRVFHTALRENRSTTSEEGGLETRGTGVTPSASLAWHPHEGRLLYLRYGSAVRQGGTTLDANGVVSKLDEDELMTLEGGWRQTVGPLDFDLGIYHSWWNDIQSDVLLDNGLVETANVGDGAITGTEISLRVPFGKDWQVDAGGMLQSALLSRDTSGLELHDRRLPVVPSWTVRGSLQRSFLLGGWMATTSATARYVGPARLSFDPALDRKMGNYLETGLAIEAKRGSWVLGLEGRNVLNSRGDTFSYGNPLRIFSTHQYVRQEPFSARLSLSFVP